MLVFSSIIMPFSSLDSFFLLEMDFEISFTTIIDYYELLNNTVLLFENDQQSSQYYACFWCYIHQLNFNNSENTGHVYFVVNSKC